MENLVIIAILVLILGGVGIYLYRVKKRGQTCVGCPHAEKCVGKCNCNGKIKD